MNKFTSMTALLVITLAAPAFAQELSGATIAGKYTSFVDEDFDNTYLSLNAGADINLGSGFGLGGNIALYNGDDLDDSLTNFTFHGTYMMSPATGLGVFVAQESDGTNEATLYGAEIGTGGAASRGEAYFGVLDSDEIDADINVAGFSYEFAVAPSFFVGIGHESFTVVDGFTPVGSTESENLTFGDTSLIARYVSDGGISAFAELGSISATAQSDDTIYTSENHLEYFAIGAEFATGRPSGALLSERTYFGFGL